jgi:hypothetical protein
VHSFCPLARQVQQGHLLRRHTTDLPHAQRVPKPGQSQRGGASQRHSVPAAQERMENSVINPSKELMQARLQQGGGAPACLKGG